MENISRGRLEWTKDGELEIYWSC
jgi:hypothetical protein